MQGTETTRAAIPFCFRSVCASTAIETSEPEAKIETAAFPSAAANSYAPLADKFSETWVLRSAGRDCLVSTMMEGERAFSRAACQTSTVSTLSAGRHV